MYEIPSACHRFESMDASHDEKRNLSFSFLQARQVPAIVDPFALVVGWRAASCFAAAISVRENLSQNELQYPGIQPAFEACAAFATTFTSSGELGVEPVHIRTRHKRQRLPSMSRRSWKRLQR